MLMTSGDAHDPRLNEKYQDVKLYVRYEFSLFLKCIRKTLGFGLKHLQWLPLCSVLEDDSCLLLYTSLCCSL